MKRVEKEMQAINPDTRIEVTVRGDIPGCRPEMAEAAEAICRAITGDNAEHVVSYGTEGGIFQDGGYSVCICGPGNIEQAHQPDGVALEVPVREHGTRLGQPLEDRPAERQHTEHVQHHVRHVRQPWRAAVAGVRVRLA